MSRLTLLVLNDALRRLPLPRTFSSVTLMSNTAPCESEYPAPSNRFPEGLSTTVKSMST